MSPHLPVTADEIAEAAIAAAEAGAAILHLHARDPKDGRPTQDPEFFKPFLAKIKASTNAVVNITTGGSPHMTVQERMRPAMAFKPEVASLNMGRSEEHTSELQSLMRISYAVFCLKKKNTLNLNSLYTSFNTNTNKHSTTT